MEVCKLSILITRNIIIDFLAYGDKVTAINIAKLVGINYEQLRI